MIHEKIYIDPSDKRVFLKTYALCDPNIASRDAIWVDEAFKWLKGLDK